MPDSVAAQVHQIAADIFNVPVAAITAGSSPETIESWESVQHLNLVLALEAHFGISIPPEDIDKMKTVGDVVRLVEALAS